MTIKNLKQMHKLRLSHQIRNIFLLKMRFFQKY